jgi:hypothetical protein
MQQEGHLGTRLLCWFVDFTPLSGHGQAPKSTHYFHILFHVHTTISAHALLASSLSRPFGQSCAFLSNPVQKVHIL